MLSQHRRFLVLFLLALGVMLLWSSTVWAQGEGLERQEEEAAIERRVFLLTVARVKGWNLTREEAEHLASI